MTGDKLVVVTDSAFDWMVSHPGRDRIEWDPISGALTRILIDSGVKETFIRQRDWEQTQAFSPEAQAARERIEKARRIRQRGNAGPQLHVHEYGLLRQMTSAELEAYASAEESITASQLAQREILKAVGVRAKIWPDVETAEAFLDARNF